MTETHKFPMPTVSSDLTTSAGSDNDNSGSGLIFRALLLMAVSIAASQNFSAKSLSQHNCTRYWVE
jgi:hypothetical protein